MPIRKKWPFALLSGVSFGLFFFLLNPLDLYLINRTEFLFQLKDFIVPLFLIALLAGTAVFLLVLLTRGIVSRILFGFFTGLTVLGYLQSSFLNFGLTSLLGDDSDTVIPVWCVVTTVLVWLAVLALFIFLAIRSDKKTVFRSVLTILLLAVLGMQLAGTSVNAVASYAPSGNESEAKADTSDASYLTYDGLGELSAGKNILIFVLDRFDVSYYADLTSHDPDFFSPLTGFTYFGDNVSLYSRTYPGAASMITGIEPDWPESRTAYFKHAFQSSPFLQDLKANDYRILLYMDNYYTYGSGEELEGIADNLSASDSYTVTDRPGLLKNMIALSLYRSLPHLLKQTIRVSTVSFASCVKVNTPSPKYELNDAKVYEKLVTEGLSESDGQSTYLFLHLRGCHDPYNMDEDGNYTEEGSARSAIRGCFNMIYSVIDQLKEKGMYEDCTIVITGDHPRARDDAKVPTQTRLTSLFVKPSGRSEEKLVISDAPVSQENLIPTLVSSAGIRTERHYGKTYFETELTEDTVRYHQFELYENGSTSIVVFEIRGCGTTFANWKEVRRIAVGSLYQ